MVTTNKALGNKLTIVFKTFALENVRYTKDVRDEIDDVRFVFNTYGKYFTFNRTEDEEEIKRTNDLISQMFIYLFPTVEKTKRERLAKVISSTNKCFDYKLVIDKSGYEEIYDAIKNKAKDVECVITELAKNGLDLNKFVKG